MSPISTDIVAQIKVLVIPHSFSDYKFSQLLQFVIFQSSDIIYPSWIVADEARQLPRYGNTRNTSHNCVACFALIIKRQHLLVIDSSKYFSPVICYLVSYLTVALETYLSRARWIIRSSRIRFMIPTSGMGVVRITPELLSTPTSFRWRVHSLPNWLM